MAQSEPAVQFFGSIFWLDLTFLYQVFAEVQLWKVDLSLCL